MIFHAQVYFERDLEYLTRRAEHVSYFEEMAIQLSIQRCRQGVGDYTNYFNRHVPVGMSREASVWKLCGGTKKMYLWSEAMLV